MSVILYLLVIIDNICHCVPKQILLGPEMFEYCLGNLSPGIVQGAVASSPPAASVSLVSILEAAD